MSLPAPYYEDDSCTIYHADALEILPHVERAGVVVTDPPYVIGAVSAGTMTSKAGGWGDMMNSSRWFRDWYRMVKERLRDDGALWSFCNWRSVPVVMKSAADAGLPVASMLVWDKQWIGPGGNVGLRPAYELVALMPRPGFSVKNRGLNDVWAEPWSAYKPHGHPAEKPERLMSRLILAGGPPSGPVLDPFMGCGTTLAAAKQLGFRSVGIEVEERYCEIAARRLAQEVLPLEMA